MDGLETTPNTFKYKTVRLMRSSRINFWYTFTRLARKPNEDNKYALEVMFQRGQSLIVVCDTPEELDELESKLAEWYEAG